MDIQLVLHTNDGRRLVKLLDNMQFLNINNK